MNRKVKGLRQRCEERLRALDLPAPFDVSAFCDRLALRRGRPIVLCPVELGGVESGLWVAGPTMDFIFFEPDTTPLHQALIQLHEACHIACGHDPVELSAAELSDLLWPDLRRDTVQRVLLRAGYSTDEEREAELLASLILRRVVGGPPRPEPRSLDSETEGVLRRLEASLERGRSP